MPTMGKPGAWRGVVAGAVAGSGVDFERTGFMQGAFLGFNWRGIVHVAAGLDSDARSRLAEERTSVSFGLNTERSAIAMGYYPTAPISSSNLDSLQTLASNGILREIVLSGTSGNLSLTAAKLSSSRTALDKIKNHAYTLSVTQASVSDTLGLGSQPALTANTKIKAIAITDTTDAIADHLDSLQQVGLRLKSITQTDPTQSFTLTGSQAEQDKVVLGKIITSYDLAVINASAKQASALSSNHRIISLAIKDTAANISAKWSLLQGLSDSLTKVDVSDPNSAIRLTASQLSSSDALLSKFTDTAQQSYKLAVSSVTAGNALAVARLHNVETIAINDTAEHVGSSLADLVTLNGQSQLKGITLTNPKSSITLEASQLVGDALTSNQAIFDKIKGGSYQLTATGATSADLASLADNTRVVSVAARDSSDNLAASLDTLDRLGSRLKTISQTDSGTALDLTQTQLESRSSVLGKITGGYTVNLTGVKTNKLLLDAANAHITSITLEDTGANLASHWNAMRLLGSRLTSVSKSDAGPLVLSAAKYDLGTADNLLSKFDSSTQLSVFGASASQTQAMKDDNAVTQIDVSDTGRNVADNIEDLATLLSGGRLATITNLTPSQSLSLTGSQMSDAQPVLDLIKSGNYSLALDHVDPSEAKDLYAANHRIASMEVAGDSSNLAAHLTDLTTLGSKVTTITQTDETALDLTGDAFEEHAATLAKIDGGFLANLTAVAADKAAGFAADSSVDTLAVSDTGSNLAAAWNTLNHLGANLTSVTQSNSSLLQLAAGDWLAGQDLRGKFTVDPTVALSGAAVSQITDLAADSAVRDIQVEDNAVAVAASLVDLAGQSKISEVALTDPTTEMDLSAQAYVDAASLFARVKDGHYTVSLSQVTAERAATLSSDTHVASMDVSDTSAAIATRFTALATANNVQSIALSDDGGTLNLTSAQILDHADTLAKISSGYQLAATSVLMADLATIKGTPHVASLSVSDSCENVSGSIGDLANLGATLSQVHLTDATPVLSLAQAAWTSGAGILAKIDTAYQVDVTATAAADATGIADNATVRHVAVSDTASNIATQWDSLVSLYNAGAGKLTSLTQNDEDPLVLTTEQQTSGAAMITDLLSSFTIQTIA